MNEVHINISIHFFFNLIIGFLLFCIVANNEIPPPVLKVPSIQSARRSSLEKQSSTTRYSRRISRQESTAVRSQQQNITEIDEDEQEDGDEDIETTTNEAENDGKDKKQEDETLAKSTDCSIM
jgi:hypothetical protein